MCSYWNFRDLTLYMPNCKKNIEMKDISIILSGPNLMLNDFFLANLTMGLNQKLITYMSHFVHFSSFFYEISHR